MTSSTCTICGQPTGAHAGPLCARCATERAAHRLAKARHRADQYRRRTRPKETP